MSTSNHSHKREDKSDKHDEHRAKAHSTTEEKPIHKPAQDPSQQPSSRGGGGLKPSDAPVLLLHRRGKADSNMLADFKDEKAARDYAKENNLIIVHSETVGDQLKLYYLPK